MGDRSKKWLQSGEVCRELGITHTTLAKLVERGSIATLTLPGISKRRYSAQDVAALVVGGTAKNASRGRELVEA